jgi:DNA-binding MarR family transcriptional regulator
MQVADASKSRRRQLHDIAEALPARVGMLMRLFLANARLGLSRTEIGVLRLLAERPRRITELACTEHITQPGITLAVNRLQERGYVARESDPRDRRAVLVTLTDAGRAAYERLRADYRALLTEQMAGLEDEEVRTLARAIEVLDKLIERLEGRESPLNRHPQNETRRTR